MDSVTYLSKLLKQNKRNDSTDTVELIVDRDAIFELNLVTLAIHPIGRVTSKATLTIKMDGKDEFE
jgi:hypothetical protein